MKETKFKQTEVGMIPSDWEVKKLGDIAQYRRGSFPQPYGLPKWYDGKGAMPFVQVADVSTDSFCLNSETKQQISTLAQPMSVFVPKNSVLVTLQGSIGKVAITQYDSYVDRTLAIFKAYNLPMSSIYFSYQLSKKFAIEREKAPGGIIKTITKEAFSDFCLPLPPTIKEQQRIANALSDVDTLINNLEKLIAKKKNIKQGAMQQLLTGRVRLPGFGSDNGHTDWFTPNGVHKKSIKTAKVVRPESIRVNDKEQCAGFKMTELELIPNDWEVKKLSSVCTIIMGQSPDSKYYNEKEGTPLIQGNADIENRETFVRFYTTKITKKGLKGDLILTVRAPVGSVAKATFDCCLGRGVCALRNANDFLYQYLIYIEKEWAKRSAGSTFDSIKSDELSATLVVVPSSKEEQTAIANVLSDMDTEISALETKLAKYRTLKTGMMQQLLTGKIRLV